MVFEPQHCSPNRPKAPKRHRSEPAGAWHAWTAVLRAMGTTLSPHREENPKLWCFFCTTEETMVPGSCLGMVFVGSHPQTDAFQQNGHCSGNVHFFGNECFCCDPVHKGVKQRDSGQAIRPHNGRHSLHKDAISRKRAQFQEEYFLAVPLPFCIDESDHFLSKRHGFHETGRSSFRAENKCSWKIQVESGVSERWSEMALATIRRRWDSQGSVGLSVWLGPESTCLDPSVKPRGLLWEE